jgi:hypothetical protein
VPTDRVVEIVDRYCSRLRKALHRAPSPERDEIVAEVRGHILERVEAEVQITEEALDGILRVVGDPSELASEYATDSMLRRAARSRSPWLYLRATLRWARTGITGLAAFLATVIGYGCAAVFLSCALLKPVLPSRIGLWLSPERTLSFGFWNGRLEGAEIYGVSVRPPFSFVLGTMGPTDGPIRELLGVWLIPVAIIVGGLLFTATTFFVRWLIGRRGRRRAPRLSSVS